MSKFIKRSTLELIFTLAIIISFSPVFMLQTEAESAYTVSGTVRYSGVILAGVSVTLYGSDGSTAMGNCTTDANGFYTIGVSETGNYSLSINASAGYYDAHSEAISLSANTTKNMVLSKAAGAPDYLITDTAGTYYVNGVSKGTFAKALVACTTDLNGDGLKINFGAPGGSLNLPEVATSSIANNLIAATYTGSVTITNTTVASTHGLKIPTGINATFDGLKILNSSVSVTTSYYMVSVSGNLTINGNTEINANVAKSTAIYVGAAGTLTTNGGSIISGASAYCINGSTCGAITINSGTITASSNYCISLSKTTGKFAITGGSIIALVSAIAISNSSTQDIIIENCTISSESSYAVYNTSTGNVNIDTSSITSKTSYAVCNTNKGNVNIKGGSISSQSGHTVYNTNTGNIKLEGGNIASVSGYAVYNTNIGNVEISGAVITSGGSYTVYNNNNGMVTMKSGSVTNTKSTGVGIFSDIYSTRTTCGEVRITGGTITAYSCVVAEGNLSVSDIADTIETPTFTSTSGTAITCSGASINPASPALLISAGNITTGSNSVVYSGKGLAVISGGTIKSTLKSKTTVANNSTGTMNITGGTIAAENTSSIAVSNASTGTMNISGGTISSDFASSVAVSNRSTGTIVVSGNPNISAKNTSCYALQNYGAGTMTITGGTISADYSGAVAVQNRVGGTVEISGGVFSAGGNCIRNDSSGIINITGGDISSTGADTKTGVSAIALAAASTGHISISGETTLLKSTDARTVILTKSTSGNDKAYIDLFGTLIYAHSKAQFYIKGVTDSGKYTISKANSSSALICPETLTTGYKLFAWTSDIVRTNVLISNPTGLSGTTFSDLPNDAHTVYPSVILYPTVTVNTPLIITANGATLKASVNPSGYDTAVFFEYGLTSSYGNSVEASPTVTGTTAIPITCDLNGLIAGKTYYYRIKCVNSVGATTYSASSTLATPKYSAKINAASLPITEDNLDCLIVTLEGTTFKNDTLTKQNFTLNNAAGVSIKGISYLDESDKTKCKLTLNVTDFDANITNLTLKIAAAELTCNTALTSNALSIKATVETAPVLETDITDIINANTTKATIVGNLKETGGEPITDFGVVYATEEDLTNDNSNTVEDLTIDNGTKASGTFNSSGSLTGAFTVNLTDLAKETSYYVRTFATNSLGTSYGTQESFKTHTYSISAIENQSLYTLTTGYAAGSQETKSIEFEWLGTGVVKDLTVALSGANAGDFEITLTKSLDIEKFYILKIMAKPGLAAGTYTATVTIKADKMTDVSFTVTQVVSTPHYFINESSSEVIINGEAQSIGTFSNATDSNGRITKTVSLDSRILDSILASKGNGVTVTIPVSGDNDVAEGVLSGEIVRSLLSSNATLVLKTDTASYTLSASEINSDSIKQQFGSDINLCELKVTVQISEQQATSANITEGSQGQFTILIPAVDFTVTCEYNGITVEVSNFNAYVERLIVIPDGVDPSKITTGIVLNRDGTFRHVPTSIVLQDGKYYAKINSLTNSVYTVVWNPVTFADVANHWAKDAVNDMGSRMIVNGDGNGNYNPDKAITRAEFAAIVVRAMGLPEGTIESEFSDVSQDDWFNGYVDTASTYGIITGYDNSTFGPNDTITREQAMTMLSRAMKVTGLIAGLSSNDVSELLAKFSDGTLASVYAKEGIAACLSAGLVTGTSVTTVSPKNYVTRAEVAVMVQRLLNKSGLI